MSNKKEAETLQPQKGKFMICKQCLFIEYLDDDPISTSVSEPQTGIAIYDDFFQGESPMMELRGVICGGRGRWIEPEDCEVVATLDKWWSLEEAIGQNFYPDGTRGFRPEDQIRMELD